MTRTFRDHAGRIHRVEMTRDEVSANRRYWAGMVAVSLAFLLAVTVAAGII